jgi:hypothetical protein
VEKRKLAEQYPDGTAAPDIDFVLTSDFNVPNGGIHARFPGFYIPILDWTFDGPEQTNTQFHTDVIIRQYDGFADFPLYPLDVIATLNALLGVIYVSPFLFDVSLQPDPTATPPTVSQHGNTIYYFFETEDLPLFGPLRTLGVPESLIDVVEPFFRVLVELGYDRTIPPGEPTPARLIPPLNPVTVTTDLVNAIGEGVNNAAALVGSPPLLSNSAPVAAAMAQPADATTATEAEEVDASPPVTSTDKPTGTAKVRSTETATGSQQISTDTATQTKDVTVTAKADQASADPKAVDVSEPTATDATVEPMKPTTRTAATDGDGLAKGGSSSVAPSSAGSHTTGSDSSNDDSSSDSGGGESE